ncbi:serine hydrolase domain-containing protein [Ensifer adhaerens]|uniref:serine hydrolase domain-containing protein n=1 Tax=Ensifer adhaerens TaxID=106592 RepID=UPI000CF179F8|nr:serine hydrolase domain-containing protein [Ensifer adhaerens]
MRAIRVISALVVVGGIAGETMAEDGARPPADLAAMVDAVEHGLAPAVLIAGAPAARRSLTDEMARLHVPGVSIAVLQGGKIAWAKGYGVVSPGGPPITPGTVFQAASISKPVAALAALRLVDRGKLDLDRDVNEQLQGWKLPGAGGHPVTLRQLLSHTAGTTVPGFPGYAAGTPVPSTEDVLVGRPPANTPAVLVDTPPGTAWRYSGGGYTVIQKLIGDATGETFVDVLRETVLDPAGMTHSSFAQPLGETALRTAAWPHDAKGDPIAGGPHTYPERAAAGLWTTPSDLARFALAVRAAASHAPDALLPPALADAMLTPVKSDYGLGFSLRTTSGVHSFSHSGSNAGYEALLVAFSGSGDGVVIMTNGQQGGELANELVHSVSVAYGWPDYRSIERPSVPVSADRAAKLAGEYQVPNRGTFSIATEAGQLSVSLKEGVSEPLYAMSANTYFVLSRDMVFHIDDATPTPTGRIVSGAFEMTFTKIR